MSTRDAYPAGVPCWVETLQPDPPTGAAFSIWEAGGRAGAQLVNEPRAWAMSSLHTPDPAGATAFYGAVFGWKSEAIAPGAPITLFRLPGYVGGEPGQAIPRDVVGVMTATERGPDGPAVPPHCTGQPGSAVLPLCRRSTFSAHLST